MRWCRGSLQDDVRHHEEEVSEGEEEMLGKMKHVAQSSGRR